MSVGRDGEQATAVWVFHCEPTRRQKMQDVHIHPPIGRTFQKLGHYLSGTCTNVTLLITHTRARHGSKGTGRLPFSKHGSEIVWQWQTLWKPGSRLRRSARYNDVLLEARQLKRRHLF